VEPDANDVPLVIINVGADMAGPRPGNDAGSPHRDLVVQGVDSSMPGRHGTSPLVLRCRGSGGSWTASTGLPQFSVPAYQLGVGGEQCGAGVFACQGDASRG
jgi:hypothetical protein